MRRRYKIVRRRLVNFLKFRILHVDDSPHRIALGVALGLFTAYMPPLGFHLFLLLFFAYVFKANKFVAFTVVWVSNPLTFIFIYYPNYLVGRSFFSAWNGSEQLGSDQVSAMFIEQLSAGNVVKNFFTVDFWVQLGHLFGQAGVEMLVGGVIVGGILGVLSYFGTRSFVVWYRGWRPEWRSHVETCDTL